MVQDTSLLLSIGSISRATGIPSNTLRSWERRYGFPAPERTEGGQRQYRSTLIPHLKLIAEALKQGHRIGKVIDAPTEQLAQLVATTSLQTPTDLRGDEIALRWLGAARALDASALQASFASEYGRRGGLAFLSRCVAPFLVLLGEAWVRDEIAIHHEHFASEQLKAFLQRTWLDLAERNTGPTYLLTTPSGERHDLGLQMAACAASLAGCRILWLGADTPADVIAAAAQAGGVAGVLLSTSSYGDPERVRRSVSELRAALPDPITLRVGGSGAPTGLDGVEVVRDLSALYEELSG
jgi:DNA-binding transcriptional MerR regulator